MGLIQNVGTPVVTARAWSYALSPRTGPNAGKYNLVVPSYNFPSGLPVEWSVVHLEDGTADRYELTADNYANPNFQYPSFNTAITTSNQLRGPDGKIYFPLRGIDDKWLAYYDPADEQPHECAPASPPSGDHSIAYSATFNHDGSKLYLGTQAGALASPCIFEVDTTTQVVRVIGVYGTPDGSNPQYAYWLARDAGSGAGADLLYVAKGQATWELFAVNVNDGTSTLLYTTSGPGAQNMQLGHTPGLGIGATITDNGVTTSYWLGDGVLSAGTDPAPTGGARATSPFTAPLPTSAPEIDWSRGIGTVRYRNHTAPLRNIPWPSTPAAWSELYAAAGVTKSAPSTIHNMQELAGDLIDAGTAGRTGVAVGAPTYQATQPGWDRKGIELTSGASNRFDLTVPDHTHSCLLWTFVAVTGAAPASTKTLFEHVTSYIEETAAGKLRIDASDTRDSVYLLDNEVHCIAQVVNVTANTADIVNDIEVLQGVHPSGGGSTFRYGGFGSTSAGIRILGAALAFDGDAELSVAERQAVMVAMGWVRPWTTVEYSVNYIAPVRLESVQILDDGALVNAEQYNGFARFAKSTGALTWFKAWPLGASQPKLLVRNGIVWICGYPDGVLFKYDPTREWEPDGTALGNPSLVGNFADTDMKYAVQIVDVNGLFWCVGRKERDANGGTFGTFDPVAGTFGAWTDEDLEDYNPNGIVVLPDANRIIVSVHIRGGVSLPEAKLQVYDLSLAKVAEYAPIPGSESTGQVFPTLDGAVVIGVFDDYFYVLDALTGTIKADLTLDASILTVAALDKSALVAITTDKKLIRVDTRTLAVRVLDEAPELNSPTGLSANPRGVYITDGPTLFRAELIGEPNKYTQMMLDLLPPGRAWRLV